MSTYKIDPKAKVLLETRAFNRPSLLFPHLDGFLRRDHERFFTAAMRVVTCEVGTTDHDHALEILREIRDELVEIYVRENEDEALDALAEVAAENAADARGEEEAAILRFACGLKGNSNGKK